MAQEPITVTIDTNCINAKQEITALNQLEEYARGGHVRLFKTDVLDTELMDYRGAHGEVARAKSSNLSEDIGILVVGHSRVGHTRLAGEAEVLGLDRLSQLLVGCSFNQAARSRKGQSLRDLMHLYTHIINRRDFFVTTDTLFLDKQDTIRQQYATWVGSPEECLEFVKRRAEATKGSRGDS